MQEGLLRDLLFVREKKRELKSHIQLIEDGITPIKAEMTKCDAKEEELESKIMEAMVKEGIKTKEHEGHSITRSERKYVKIVDNDKLLEALSDKYIAPLKRIVGKTYEELRQSLVKPAELDTKKAREYVDILTKVENVEQVEGTEVQITEYLTIK